MCEHTRHTGQRMVVNGAPSEHRVWSVGALVLAIADALQGRFNPVRVRGEISGFSRAGSGHCYFSLKDSQGQLRCAMFRRVAQASGIDWRDGQMMDVEGRLDVYGPRGDLQLIVESARLAGQGSLFEQFLQRKAELEAEGCFDPARKRPLVTWPRSVSVVTSLDAAALRDVASALRRRVPHLPVRVFPSPVQGEAAPQALCAALEAAYAHHRQTGHGDVLLLIRGGGSLEDLWAFNSPQLVRTMRQAPMPIVCGVGHETDFTLADFAADLRAPTPTAAAELCAPSRDVQAQAMAAVEQALKQSAWRVIDSQSQRLDRLAVRMGQPSQRISVERQRHVSLAHRLWSAVRRRLDRDTQRLDRWPADVHSALQREIERQRVRVAHQEAQLTARDPRQVLARGYALITDADGRVVASSAAVEPGQAVHAQLAHGQLDLTVTASGS